jgi:hypothetical protein
MKNSKLSKKNSGVPEKKGKQTQEEYKKRFDELAGVKIPKPYPVPEEDSFIPPDDDSAEVKYNTKKNKHNP